MAWSLIISSKLKYEEDLVFWILRHILFWNENEKNPFQRKLKCLENYDV